jgi:hypothetical protein
VSAGRVGSPKVPANRGNGSATAALGQPDEKRKLDLAKLKLQIIHLMFDDLTSQPVTSEAWQKQ